MIARSLFDTSKPLIAHKGIHLLKPSDVETFMHDVITGKTAANIKTGPRGLARVTGGPGIARKAVKLLATIYNYAIKHELATINPCLHVDVPPPSPRTRWLNPDDYHRLGKALLHAKDNDMNPRTLVAIRALALTGCRKNEILTLKRTELDATGQCLRLETTKTGAQIRPCGQAALGVLQQVATSHDSMWVFPSPSGKSHLANIRKPLLRVCSFAGLEAVSAHTLRHSYATVAHELGYSELTIAGLLGHSAGSVTSRYAHHVDAALVSAADVVSGVIAERIGIDVGAWL